YLQVTSGCSHNRCTFCGYFKDTGFKRSPLDEIEADIKEIPKYFGAPERIFLQGADGFAATYDTLMKTAELIHKYVPSVKTIGGYARIDNFIDKTVEQLRSMRDVGYSDPYIGVESGDDVILKRVHKGYDARTAREQLEKLTAAKFSIIANFLNGLGGRDYGLDHARLTAELYDGINISMIEVSSLTLIPKTNLYYQKMKGKFVEATEVERLREMQEFLRRLTNRTIFLSDHISMPFFVRAELPARCDEIIEAIEHIIDEVGEKALRRHRDLNPIM
ncbi:MAG: radical SAM protein, partial [Selenomonadaceae bacterium]|nr:radical SAM protein [Selenomonadaceae bacterium]